MFIPFGFMATQAAGGDADANAYISAVTTAGGSFSGAEETAIQSFFIGLKSDGIYSKLHVMYPFLGGVADSNKINAANPGTNDLTFNGTWTHSSTGSYCARSDSNYADTGFNISTSASPGSDFSAGAMVISGSTQGYMGVGTGQTNYILIGTFNGTEFFYPTGPIQPGGTGFRDSGAFMAVNRNAESDFKTNRAFAGGDGTLLISTHSTTYSTPYDATWYFNGINGLNGFNMEGIIQFGYLSEGLTDDEIQNLVNNLKSLNTTFGRNMFV